MSNLRIVAAAVALAAAAGCGSSHATSVPTRAQVLNHLTAAYVQYTRCARAHGLPDLPDPQVDDNGNDHYPPNSIPASGFPASVLQGCQVAWNTVRHWRDQLDQERNQSGSRTNVQADLRFVQCIRQHGFPDFPDPPAEGQTPVSPPPGFDKSNLSPAARAAIQACQGT